MLYKAYHVSGNSGVVGIVLQIALTGIALNTFPENLTESTVLSYTYSSLLACCVLPFWFRCSGNFKRPYITSLIVLLCVWSISGISIWEFNFFWAFVVFSLLCSMMVFYCAIFAYRMYLSGGKTVLVRHRRLR